MQGVTYIEENVVPVWKEKKPFLSPISPTPQNMRLNFFDDYMQ